MPKSKHLLIVEDDESANRSLAEILRTAGWKNVHQAYTVAQAKAALLEPPPPDYVLLDLSLPDGDGQEVLDELAASQCPARVVVMTGTDDQTGRSKLWATGAYSVMVKPLQLSTLFHLLGA